MNVGNGANKQSLAGLIVRMDLVPQHTLLSLCLFAGCRGRITRVPSHPRRSPYQLRPTTVKT